MPLVYAHNINDDTRLAIWQIEEEEAFFKRDIHVEKAISHPHKRLQHLAGRYLLRLLDPAFPVNEIKIDGKRPFLKNNSHQFSISHCGDFAAAIVSQTKSVGIDVELCTEKMHRLQHKFLTAEEHHIINSADSLPVLKKLTAAWSAKETMFKWYKNGHVDFKKDMIIRGMEGTDEQGTILAFFGKDRQVELHLPFIFFDHLCLAWCCQ